MTTVDLSPANEMALSFSAEDLESINAIVTANPSAFRDGMRRTLFGGSIETDVMAAETPDVAEAITLGGAYGAILKQREQGVTE